MNERLSLNHYSFHFFPQGPFYEYWLCLGLAWHVDIARHFQRSLVFINIALLLTLLPNSHVPPFFLLLCFRFCKFNFPFIHTDFTLLPFLSLSLTISLTLSFYLSLSLSLVFSLYVLYSRCHFFYHTHFPSLLPPAHTCDE